MELEKFIKCDECGILIEVGYHYEEVGDCESGPMLEVVDIECGCVGCGRDLIRQEWDKVEVDEPEWFDV